MNQIRRREFLIAVGAFLTAPLPAATILSVLVAVPSLAASPPVVGQLVLGTAETNPGPAAGLARGLKSLGHEVGRTLLIERRYAIDDTRFPALAQELLERKPAVLVSPCGLSLRAIREISKTVPVIAVCADENNFLGEVASLRRPGGATTGFTFLGPESASKRLEILKDIRPGLKRVAFLYQSSENWDNYWREIERVAPAMSLAVLRLPIRYAEDLENAFATALRDRADALVTFTDPVTTGAANRIAEFALKHRLATAADFLPFTTAGGLFSYSPDLSDLFERVAAPYIDKILKGTKPGELPIVQPTKFDLVFNLKTVKALGITIPQSILLRADRVIE